VLTFVMLPIEIWELDRVALKMEMGNGVGEWRKQYGSYCFCGPCVCLGIFLLFYKRVFMLGIAGAWGCVKVV
jgi:hypothetical protein